MKLAFLLAALAALVATVQASAQSVAQAIILQYDGHTERGVTLYAIAIGDTRKDDLALERRPDRLMPFKLDAAQYGAVGDGSWRLAQFRMPDLGGGPQSQAFLDYLKRKDVQALLDGDLYADADFGKPGDFIYKRKRVSSSELPDPLNRLSAQALAPIAAVFEHNADGAMTILLKSPFDQEPNARRALARIKTELGLP